MVYDNITVHFYKGQKIKKMNLLGTQAAFITTMGRFYYNVR